MQMNKEIHEIVKWDELDISSDLLRGIYAYGFENPSPIQCKAIRPILEGKDVIAQAQSGTGKTAAFAVSALSKINLNLMFPQVIVLAPTRELANQITNVIQDLGSMMKNLRVTNLVGGTLIQEDSSMLRQYPPHIITGCPGRINDLLRRQLITVQHVKLLILDEADVMLSMGFKDQVKFLFQQLSENVQVAIFSATLPPFVKEISQEFMRNSVEIVVKKESLTLEGIAQYYVKVKNYFEKFEVLKDLFSTISVSQCIIYCNSVKRVVDLYYSMVKDDYPVCCIHSQMDKKERDVAFQEFRTGKQRVLISSGVTERGIDIQQVSVVINFDLPKDVCAYLHRIGRSGRWGRKGTSINLVTQRDEEKKKEIEEYYQTQIIELPNLSSIFL